jgi:hypothetical protein
MPCRGTTTAPGVLWALPIGQLLPCCCMLLLQKARMQLDEFTVTGSSKLPRLIDVDLMDHATAGRETGLATLSANIMHVRAEFINWSLSRLKY